MSSKHFFLCSTEAALFCLLRLALCVWATLLGLIRQVVEYTVRYDVDSEDVVGCEIEESNEGGQCTVEIEVEE